MCGAEQGGMDADLRGADFVTSRGIAVSGKTISLGWRFLDSSASGESGTAWDPDITI
jgi:hypothetical protein